MYKVFVERVTDGKTVFEKILDFKDRDSLQEAQNEAIVNWINIQGKYARIAALTDGSLAMKVHGNLDREIWKIIS